LSAKQQIEVGMLENVRIVLVDTTHPGNIGAAARAMKTMGLKQLTLVTPHKFPHADATAMASGADDVLASAIVVDTLEQAIADCHLVIATSARCRTLPWPMLLPREAAEKMVAESQTAPVACVFGREKYGLLNSQLQACQFHVQIPSDASYGVLNIAAAVQVLCYELRLAALAPMLPEAEELDGRYPTQAALELFFQHLERALIRVNFLDRDNPRKVLPRLRRLFQRVRLESIELGILRGFLAMVEQRCDEAGRHGQDN
jgi:tRNA (cytidine32/uridine32-2'-O)-methyltransferase